MLRYREKERGKEGYIYREKQTCRERKRNKNLRERERQRKKEKKKVR